MSRHHTLPLLLLGLALGSAAAPGVLAAKRTRMIVEGTDPAVSPDGDRLAFVRVRGGNADVWIAGLDGSEPRRLTDHDARDASPAWSPDGTRIVFSSHRTGGGDLYIAPVDGSIPPRRLTAAPGAEDDPDWSPDGALIAFTFHDAGRTVIGVVPVEGGEITVYRGRRGELWDPAWSPDRREIAAVTDENVDTDIVILDLAAEARGPGRGQRILAVPRSDELEPDWHPGRGLLVFTSDRREDSLFEGEVSRDRDPAARTFRLVYSGAATSLGRLRLVARPARTAAHPVWTADGTGVVYVTEGDAVSGRGGDRMPEIWIRERYLRPDRTRERKKTGR